MVEAVLLQIPPSIRKALQVRVANHPNSVMYAKHVLLHSLILLLLNLIQCPYHGIIVPFVTKCLLHVRQQVLHRDILAFVQCAGPFTGVPVETGKDKRILASSYCSRKASTSNRQSVYVTSTPGSVDLKISISNLAGANCFFSVLPLWPLHVLPCLVRGEPPPPTTIHWDLGGHLCRCAAPAQVVSLASAIPSTVVDLPACWGALPTSCIKVSDSPALTTGILGAGFSAQLLSLWQPRQQQLTTMPPSEVGG